MLLANGQLLSAAAYGPIIVSYRNGHPVRLNEVARVYDGVENDKSAGWFVDKDTTDRSIVMMVQRQPGSNVVAVVDEINRLLPTLRSQLPPAVSLHVASDRSEADSRIGARRAS